MRSLFPVHPIAAAIQSIGVCQRDLEGNKTYGVGRIILPAVLFHGAFDFVLMLVALIIGMRHVDGYLDPDEKTPEETQETPADARLDLISLACGFVMVLIGIIYYVEVSRAQKKRLEELETSNWHDPGVDIPLVV